MSRMGSLNVKGFPKCTTGYFRLNSDVMTHNSSSTQTKRFPFSSLVSAVIPVLFIASCVLFAYRNVFYGEFLFDDEHAVVNNESIRSVWPLSQSLWGPQDSPTAGRPVVNFSFALNYAANQFDVTGYHAVNVVLHILNASILFAFVFRLAKHWVPDESSGWTAWSIAFAVSLLWSIHPLQTEAVGYITQRTELLMSFFFLGTLYSACRAWDAKSRVARFFWHSACVVGCGLGMASKEVMFVAPLMVMICDLTVLNKKGLFAVKSRLPLYASLLATWIIFALLLIQNPRGRTVGFGLSTRPIDYLTTQFWVVVQYLRLAIWPDRLCGDYGIFQVTEVERWLPCLVFLLGLVGLIALASIRWRWVLFIGAWFFLILAPSSSIVPITTEPFAERRMYLPLAAIVALTVIVLVACVGKSNVIRTVAWTRNEWRVLLSLAVFTCVVSGVFAWNTYHRIRVFNSEEVFWKDVVEKRPMNARGFQSLALVYLKKNDVQLASEYFRKSEALAPKDDDSLYNLGVWKMRLDKSMKRLLTSIKRSRQIRRNSRRFPIVLNCCSLSERLTSRFKDSNRRSRLIRIQRTPISGWATSTKCKGRTIKPWSNFKLQTE